MLMGKISARDEAAIGEMLAHTEIDFVNGDIILDGQTINERIRTPEISKMASACSAVGEVRAKLVELQRAMGMKKSVIMDGRDIGTNVMPDAEYKFFLTASAEERAKRRFLELGEKGQAVAYEQVLKDIIERDHNDASRKLNPLAKAADAIEIDTTGMSIDEVTDAIIKEVNKDGDSKTV